MRIDLVEFLARETSRDIDSLKVYINKRRVLWDMSIKDEGYAELYKEVYGTPGIPSKLKIKESLKMIRRMTLEIEKEIDSIYI